MNKDNIQVCGKPIEVEYSDDGIEYDLTVSYGDLEKKIRIKAKTFPYIYWINGEGENKEIVYIRYLGDGENLKVPFFDCYDNNYSSTLYSYNPYIGKLKFQEGVTNI